jgi:protein involved in polysaccharide export with SLBB domain
MKATFVLFALLVASTTMARGQQPNPQPSPAEEKYVCVIGGVARPSRVTLNGRLTVAQAIKETGGILPDARTLVRVYSRTTDGVTRVTTVDLKAAKKKPALDLELQSYDLVEVLRKKSGYETIGAALKPCLSQARQ